MLTPRVFEGEVSAVKTEMETWRVIPSPCGAMGPWELPC